MYVTRPLSLYKTHPYLLSISPVENEGPGSGYLVLHNEDNSLKDLPFPQNKVLTTSYRHGSGHNSNTEKHKVLFIPVINQPLSSNCYYVMIADTHHKGLACTSESDEDPCCCAPYADKEPERHNPDNIYQQFEIIKDVFKIPAGHFSAKSVDLECRVPAFLRQGWRIKDSNTNIAIGEADGLNSILRSQHPDFDFPLSTKLSQSEIVGKWYCPYMFIVDGTLKEQMEKSMFYEITLEQQWERIFSCERSDEVGADNSVFVSVVLSTELVKISGVDAVSKRNEAKNIIWFWITSKVGFHPKIGLSFVITERMKWEQERVGWVGGNEEQLIVARTETYTRGGSWKKFSCYVLVERFVLKRLDRSILLTYEFKHIHNIRCKWE